MKNFWKNLKPPFTILAPLDGVTDHVFRQMIVRIGKPDVLFTEFTTCDGLLSLGHKKVAQNLLFKPNEQPIIAQIWGINPESFYQCAKYIKDLGFAGIDINMGCPAYDITKIGACSALIKNPNLAQQIINATKQGAAGLPVSVKTRIGFESENLQWIEFLLKQDLAALTIHLRTVKEQSKVPAHWELMPKILKLRDSYAKDTLIIGNGDLLQFSQIEEKFAEFGCEGFMIGRGVLQNPWFFNSQIKEEDLTIQKRLDTFMEHIELFEQTWGESRNFETLKKFCKAYIQNFKEAAKYREEMMATKSLKQLKLVVLNFQQHHRLYNTPLTSQYNFGNL